MTLNISKRIKDPEIFYTHQVGAEANLIHTSTKLSWKSEVTLGTGYDDKFKSKEENKRKRKGDENFDGEGKKIRKSKKIRLSSKNDLQSSSCDESSKVEIIQEKLIKRLRELLEISKGQ